MEDRDDKGRFKQGNKQSKGRPKGSLSINDELRKLLKKKDAKSGKSYLEAMAIKILKEAMEGNERLMIELWQQIDGKARQAVDVGGQEGNPLGITIISPAGDKIEIDDDA